MTRDLNGQLQDARMAAGPRRDDAGPGLVIQLTDSSATVPQGSDGRDYLVSGQDVLAVVEELWLAGAEGVAVNGERVTSATAIVDIGGSVLVNSAYLAPPYQVSAIGPADMFDRLTTSPGFVDFIRTRAETFGIGVDYATPRRGRPARLRRIGEPPVRPAGRLATALGGALMRKRSGRIAVAAVLFVLGFLVVVQLRSQAADQGLNGLSVQELTELVANLTTRNNQLRQEIQALDRQHDQVAAAVERGDTSAVQVRADLNRVLGWSGAVARDRCRGAGDGRRAPAGGRPRPAAQRAAQRRRRGDRDRRHADRGGRRPERARAARCSSADTPLGDPIELVAVGQPQTLAGSLTRAGGPIAQLAARYPDVVITVERGGPRRPARRRSATLAPILGRPRSVTGWRASQAPIPATLCYPAGRCQAIPCSRCCWATWSGSSDATRAAATRGSSTGWGPTSASAATTCDRHVLIERPALERRIVEFVEAR